MLKTCVKICDVRYELQKIENWSNQGLINIKKEEHDSIREKKRKQQYVP